MAQVDFPYGKKCDWELDTADADIGLRSVPDSCVIAHSLRQSREKWLLHTFPKFTSKARGAKAPDPPPPHTIMSRGKCNLAIGPHQFRDTVFYEVHYMQPSSAVPMSQAPPSLPATAYSSNYANGSQPSAAPTTKPASASSDDQDLSQLKLALGGGMEYTISADLVARIHHEASVNPIFATKFRLAVDPNATQEQIRNFAFALPHLPGVRVSGVPTSLTLSTERQQQVRLPPIREWDLVIEFNEMPNERWLIPRGTLASCSRLVTKDASSLPEVSLTLRLPLPQIQSKTTNAEEPSASEKTSDSVPPRSAKLTLRQTPNAVYDLILNWIGGDDKNRENAAALAKIPKRQKVYLPHRISQGALLTQLQAAQAPNYTMKPLKQGPSNPPRPRRKPQKRKSTLQELAAAPDPSVEKSSNTAAAASATKQVKPPQEPKEPKRRRYQSTAKAAPVPIRCLVCLKTDVPLMMGGRYCRECVDAGKANVAIPQLPPRGSQSSYSFTPYTPPIASTVITSATATQPTQSVSAITGVISPSTTPSTPQSQPTTQTPVSPDQ